MSFFYRIGLIYFFTVSCTFGQKLLDGIKYRIESGAYISTSGKTPFLQRANQYGTVPLENPLFTVGGSFYKEYDSTYNADTHQLNRFSVGYGANVLGNIGKSSEALLPEGYFKVRYGVFELYGGRRKEIVGLVDSVLSSGSYIWSGNALPIPKVQISIPNYFPILGKGLISAKGAYAHGWFDNGQVKNFYLHQKYLYVRVGRPNWRIKLYAGANHQVQWGGRPAEPYIDKATKVLITRYPADLISYVKIIAGISINRGDLNTTLPLTEAWNRPGNHLGTIDLAAEIDSKNYNIFIYRQSIYDDGSLFYLNNITDGLLGISLKRKFVDRGLVRVSVEYLDTRSQGGPYSSENTIPELRGTDNYFQNNLYVNGWTYKKNIIGTPLLVPAWTISSKNLPGGALPDEKLSTFILSRVQAFSVAFEGKAKNLNYYTKILVNTNLGNYGGQGLEFYGAEANLRQIGFLCKAKYNLPKFSLISSVAFDEGTLFPTTIGAYLGVQRTFF